MNGRGMISAITAARVVYESAGGVIFFNSISTIREKLAHHGQVDTGIVSRK